MTTEPFHDQRPHGAVATNDPGGGEDALLIEYLHERDEPCPLCGYNLRGLRSRRCPECGRDLRLSVGAVEPFQRAWVALAAITCAAAGLGVFFGLAVLVWGWPRPRRGAEGALVTYSILAFWCMIPIAIVVLRRRRGFMRLRTEAQWRWVWAAGIFAGTAFASFFIATQ